MLWFVHYLLRFHLASDWLRNNKHFRNFLWCSRFYGKDCTVTLKLSTTHLSPLPDSAVYQFIISFSVTAMRKQCNKRTTYKDSSGGSTYLYARLVFLSLTWSPLWSQMSWRKELGWLLEALTPQEEAEVVPQRKDHCVAQRWTQQSCLVSWSQACLLSIVLLAGVHDVSVNKTHL